MSLSNTGGDTHIGQDCKHLPLTFGGSYGSKNCSRPSVVTATGGESPHHSHTRQKNASIFWITFQSDEVEFGGSTPLSRWGRFKAFILMSCTRRSRMARPWCQGQAEAAILLAQTETMSSELARFHPCTLRDKKHVRTSSSQHSLHSTGPAVVALREEAEIFTCVTR